MFTNLRFARKENRIHDVAVLEEQVNQILCEWKAELNEPTPASSLLADSVASFSSELARLLWLCDEEDDATSVLAEPAILKHGLDVCALPAGPTAIFDEDYHFNHAPPQDLHNMVTNSLEMTTQSDYFQFDTNHDFNNELFICPSNIEQYGGHAASDISVLLSSIHTPPSAFLGPKCALWDCPRPAQGSDRYKDYCSPFHAELALKEGPPGMAPVLRPGGIGLKDGLLFNALRAKMQGKDVGIPECEGAATAKSPWNAPELFDINILKGEAMREWLFFDKPRKAFGSGNRKQRCLSDYNGRGWHESRKQVVKEFGGLKKSYYMDPQPRTDYEWHLFEYEVDNCDSCALYRLELKLADGKKSPKGKVANDLADLQKRMGRLSADFPAEHKCPVNGKSKGNMKSESGDALSASIAISCSDGSNVHGLLCPPRSAHPGLANR
ncbi:hypothetical protein Nepgr_000393 [Nepenthes gracilis]|uniref:Transcription factor VOZ1 n=1 Tax=Nepenthes gracilis TaxID=150966 RepID=A0AAD3P695_NEPGR|nr:hypothetical protein Nepgr_000393 [Nepenthes gracilis]